jgi:anthranilate phosphoribosyltransferase
LINAAAAIHLTNFADDLPEALALAQTSLESGAAFEKLQQLIIQTNK